MAVILITHDLGVIAEIADHVIVMYAGRIVETGTLDQIFYDPQHPYTWGLLGSLDPARPAATCPAGADRRAAAVADLAARRAATSAPAARTRSTAAPRCRRSRYAGVEPGHADRCWLSPEQKRTLRVVDRPRSASRRRRRERGRRVEMRARPSSRARRRRRRPTGRAARGRATSSSTSRSRSGSCSTARSARCGRSTASRFTIGRGRDARPRRRVRLRQVDPVPRRSCS